MKRSCLQTRRKSSYRALRPQVEWLEARALLSVAPGPVPLVPQPVANETLDRAASASLGDLTLGPAVLAEGVIGSGPARAADVAWYQFTLDRPADVRLTLGARPGTAAFAGTLSLYNSDPFDFADVYDPVGTRLLAQAGGSAAAPAVLDRPLAAGTYAVAVSGAGNRYFSPYLAGSGVAGTTGAYALQAAATDLGRDPAGPPQMLAADAAPQIVRLDLSAPLDPAASATLTDANGNAVDLLWTNFSASATELQLAPARALAPGGYTVAVTDGLGRPVFSAAVTVPAGAAAFPDDTTATARDLGDVTRSGLVQVSGAVGSDPYYDSLSADPALNPGNQADLYHFRISGPGRYAVTAEVFAGRVGSPLTAGVSLYRRDPASGQLVFVAGNDGTGNPAQGTDGSLPLFADPALSAGLTAGDYYVAVAGASNTPSPEQGFLAGPGSGLFDPNVSRSGQNGWSTGPYVLNLLAYPAPAPPVVLSASVAEGQTLDAPPVTLTVRFNEPVNLSQLAFDAFQQTAQDTVSAVYVMGPGPAGSPGASKYFPRLQSYDRATNEATFLMLDRLPAGDYALHLSGAAGLTDAAGNPLAGNDPGGDYVIHFRVGDDAILPRTDQGASGDPAHPQDLGTLFPHELQGCVYVSGTFPPAAGAAAAGQAHYYRFQVLQGQTYFIGLSGTRLPADATLALYDTSGNLLAVPPPGLPAGAQVMNVPLNPGTYVIEVRWGADQAGTVYFELALGLQGNADNPPPLLSGAAPAIEIRLDSAAPPTAPAPPVVALPPTTVAPANAVTTAPADTGRGGGPAVGVGPGSSGGALLALGDGPVGGRGSAAAASAVPAAESVVVVLPGGSGATGYAVLTIATQFDGPPPAASAFGSVAVKALDGAVASLLSGTARAVDGLVGSLASVIEVSARAVPVEDGPAPEAMAPDPEALIAEAVPAEAPRGESARDGGSFASAHGPLALALVLAAFTGAGLWTLGRPLNRHPRGRKDAV